MKVAFIGPPNSGKSTLFSAVTGMAHDPYAPSEAVHAVVRVPDPRLAYLVDLYQPKKITEASIEFVDVPGCSLDDTAGQDQWRRLLPAVRQCEALVVVVRDFENPSVPTYRNRIDAAADLASVWDELIFADLDQVTNRLERLDKALKKPTKTHEQEKREFALLQKCKDALEANQALSTVLSSADDQKQLASFAFLTEMPLVSIRNVADDRAATAEGIVAPHVVAGIALSASIEAEITALDPSDRAAFLADLGLGEPARDRLIRTCYDACGLISFLTMGPDEVRAWTIPKGATAVEAAGKIHSDLARGFVRAETVAYDDLVANKDMRGAKAAGKVRKEGRTYVVADGDIMNILATT